MNVFKKLPKRTQRVLEELDDSWRLEDGKRHIRIFINETFAGIMPKNCRGDGSGGDRRAELNVISQIRRAARGVASNRRLELASQ